jgi:hypothetical protein
VVSTQSTTRYKAAFFFFFFFFFSHFCGKLQRIIKIKMLKLELDGTTEQKQNRKAIKGQMAKGDKRRGESGQQRTTVVRRGRSGDSQLFGSPWKPQPHANTHKQNRKERRRRQCSRLELRFEGMGM